MESMASLSKFEKGGMIEQMTALPEVEGEEGSECAPMF